MGKIAYILSAVILFSIFSAANEKDTRHPLHDFSKMMSFHKLSQGPTKQNRDTHRRHFVEVDVDPKHSCLFLKF